ncbi:hypothetical protein G7Z17_g12838 [Cylindrodendrum hubeiense]|uniref:Inhibitor I9 domain-containing protein n=1 Tax=Cylindrodendrum hubeiense TaxID=595255 RepID=A0A9P5H274_9HYPO|nr:hypothetical protein G7Z17_g12838 [Cylindrodendrum hubeiense]
MESQDSAIFLATGSPWSFIITRIEATTCNHTFPNSTIIAIYNTKNHHQDNPNKPAIMPTYIVSCKEGATDDQVKAVKQQAIDQGGKIEHEYTLIKGFSVSYPEGTVTTLESHEHVQAVEADQEVRTQ